MLAVIIGVMLASVGSARNVPYVPEVLHPPVPQEGKYEEKKGSYFRKRPISFQTVLKSDLQGTNCILSTPQADKPCEGNQETPWWQKWEYLLCFQPSLCDMSAACSPTATNQNLIQEKIKRLNSGNACYHSVQTFCVLVCCLKT
jgi:hypothetical protein